MRQSLPHLVALLADDFGWGNVGYHHASREVATPNIDALKAEGVELTRHYAYRFCSPSRSAFQSGRLPVHVNTRNAEPTVRNPSDPVGGYAGIPVNMTSIAQVLKRAGYAAHFVGKWDVGMATWRHTPLGRGCAPMPAYLRRATPRRVLCPCVIADLHARPRVRRRTDDSFFGYFVRALDGLSLRHGAAPCA